MILNTRTDYEYRPRVSIAQSMHICFIIEYCWCTETKKFHEFKGQSLIFKSWDVRFQRDGFPSSFHFNSSASWPSNRSLKPYRNNSRSATRSTNDVGVRMPAEIAPRSPATSSAVPPDDPAMDRRRCPVLAILWYRRLPLD